MPLHRPQPFSLELHMNRLFLCVTTAVALCAQLPAQMTEDQRIEMPGQVVVSFASQEARPPIQPYIDGWDLTGIEPQLQLDGARSLMCWQRRGETLYTNLALLEFNPANVDTSRLLRELNALPGVAWAVRNVGYTGEVKELEPSDPQYSNQYHHPLMQNHLAWDITLGDASVIIGVTDDGMDTDHEDLAGNLWVNTGEIPGDGIDNDGNGFVDDTNGFDFVFDNGDPNPNDNGDDHGTHCAGIAGAGTDNGIGVSGTAGGATLMPLQFFSSGEPWTAVNIADSFIYGADNGARIITTSYNINGWVGDPVVTAAFDYIYDAGVLHFNSAGNGNQLNPARQAFTQTLLVASTTDTDARSSFSNFGTGIDLAAPGSDILSTVLNDNYDFMSGTSMASPNAAGVAALIWSANPTWTRDQVAAQICGTGDSIDAQNPGFEGLLGGGRVNSYRALTETLPAPQFDFPVNLPSDGGGLFAELTTFELHFNQILDPNTVNVPGAIRLDYAGADGTFGTADDVNCAVTWDEYLISSNGVFVDATHAITETGLYRVTADASIIANPFGTALDGNADGVPGDDWITTFSACAAAVLLEDPAESGVDWSVVNENLISGSWTSEPEVPIGGGIRNDPIEDFDGSGKCFLTENAPGNTDVDGGPTRLISRAFDLTISPDPYLSFAAWLDSDNSDSMTVDVSGDNGATWVPLGVLFDTDGWEVITYRVSDAITPTANTRLRFSVEDAPGPSTVEAGIDTLRIVEVDCTLPEPVGTSYCVGATNSIGLGAMIRAEGSDVVANNDFTLITEQLPPGVFSLYLYGTAQNQQPLGDGFLCVGGTLTRLIPAQVTSAGGVATLPLDLTAFPAVGDIVSGVTRNFQLWYRDSGGGSNLSDALEVLWR